MLYCIVRASTEKTKIGVWLLECREDDTKGGGGILNLNTEFVLTSLPIKYN